MLLTLVVTVAIFGVSVTGACRRHSDCLGLQMCVQRRCTPAKPAGGHCTDDSHCERYLGQACISGICMVPVGKPVVHPSPPRECYAHEECFGQRLCINFACVPAIPLGECDKRDRCPGPQAGVKRRAASCFSYSDQLPGNGPTPQRLTCVRVSAVQVGDLDVNSILERWRNGGDEAYAWNYVNQATFFDSTVCGVQLDPQFGYEVTISRWFTPDDFSVNLQVFEPLLRILDSALSAVYSQIATLLPFSNFDRGMACCVMDYSGKWRRARVERCSSSEYHVKMVDTGELMFVERQHALLLLSCFAELPPMALHCTMQDFGMKLYGRAAHNFFHRQLKSGVRFIMTFTNVVNGVLAVQLFDSAGKSVYDVWADQNPAAAAQREPYDSSVNKNPSFYGVTSEDGHNQSLNYMKLFGSPVVPLNVPVKTRVLTIDVKTAVACFRITDEEHRLKSIEDYLATRMAKLPSDCLYQHWKTGDACVVKSQSEANRAYRAVIVDIMPSGYATVQSCDYGFQTNELLSELCLLEKTVVTSYPPLAFSAKLLSADGQPQGGLSSLSADIFSREWDTNFYASSDGILLASIIG